MSSRVDYDAIAHLYDEPRRDHAPDRLLEKFLAERRSGPSADVRVLDVGCGTGKQLASNRARFGKMTLVGVDRSAGMLRIARAREAGVAWIQGDAQALPVGSRTVDYATNQFSYPHISDKTQFVSEIFRVLRPGGRLLIADMRGTREYQTRLANAGISDVTRRSLGWRFWWGGPFGATRLVTGTKPLQEK